MGIITGLPKSEGLTTSTDDLRPITVGPALNRLLHKILADRLATMITKHNLIDKAQFAFLPGGDIHEPINTATACYRDRINKKSGCYAVYYDISKAYDTISWSSIQSALERIGVEPAFISFVMSVLNGTKVAMRTNVPGHITRTVELHKSIKQGCPLAPLLFIIVMDELHSNLREFNLGYKLDDGPRVNSRGYCDDTGIVSNSFENFKRMNNEVVFPFFQKHGLLINEIKTKVTGRHADGTALTDTMSWPGSGRSFITIDPKETVRYLGAHISLDLDWSVQIKKMESQVYATAAHLDSGRFTLLQGLSITKYVTGPKMEIGMRHAIIPREKLQTWDKVISRALARSSGVTNGGLHISGTSIALKLVPLEDLYDTIKLSHTTEMLTRETELRLHYRKTLSRPLSQLSETIKSLQPKLPTMMQLSDIYPGDHSWPSLIRTLKEIATKGLWIATNTLSRSLEKPPTRGSKSDDSTKTPVFKGIPIPTRDTHDLWGANFDKLVALGPLLSEFADTPETVTAIANLTCYRTARTYHCPGCPRAGTSRQKPCTMREVMDDNLIRATCSGCKDLWKALDTQADQYINAEICTDGSTYPGRPSAAAFIFLEDGAETRELWGVPGYYWRLPVSDNYVAEMAAIHKAIRSIPVNVNLTIHTDSTSSIDSIGSALRCPTGLNLLRRGARPHLLAIIRAIQTRASMGGKTKILHVRAHTGGRDRVSIGNACADQLAKWCAIQPTPQAGERSHLDLMAADHPFVIHICHPTNELGTTKNNKEMTCELSPAHGDIRKACKIHMKALRTHELSRRDKVGQLVRDHQGPTFQTIDRVHSELKNSAGLSMILQAVNQVTIKTKQGDAYRGAPCHRCGRGEALTFEHRAHSCPRNTTQLNDLDDDIASHTGYIPDHEIPGPCPTSLYQISLNKKNDIIKMLCQEQGPLSPTRVGGTINIPTTQMLQGSSSISLDFREMTGSIANYALMCVLSEQRAKRYNDKADPADPSHQIQRSSSADMGNQILSHLRYLADDLHNPNPRTDSPPLRMTCRHILRTYSDLHYNILTSHAPWDDDWCGKHPGSWIVGSTISPSQGKYLQNRCTWVSMRADTDHQLEDVRLAREAVITSTEPARVALLLQDSAKIQHYLSEKEEKVRRYVLLRINADTGPVLIHETPARMDKTEPPPLEGPTMPMLLLILENKMAPAFDADHLRIMLEPISGIEVMDSPKAPGALAPDIDEPIPITHLKHRYHPLLRRSQTWFNAKSKLTPAIQRKGESKNQPDEIKISPEQITPRQSANDRLHITLALLGALPRGFSKDLASHWEEEIDNTTSLTISKTILNKSLELFKKDEAFRKWKRKNVIWHTT